MFTTVYLPVPHASAASLIDLGSGIVGDEHSAVEGRVLAYSKGNRYGASNIVTFADRVGNCCAIACANLCALDSSRA